MFDTFTSQNRSQDEVLDTPLAGNRLAAPPATYVALPDVITIREGQTINSAIQFIGMRNHSVSYDYWTTTAGGTATWNDFSGVSGSGSMSVWSSYPYTETQAFSISAVRDDIVEETEIAYLAVRLGGNMYFADGTQYRTVEIRIIDDNMTTGTNGHDMLRGTSAAENLSGGLGNDRYFVTAGDRVIELANGGIDEVHSAFSYTLTANVENLVLTGNANIKGIGNALDNRITGSSGNNTLNGGTGADTLIGGAGNDLYVTDGNDVIIENANGGHDQVNSNVTYVLGANLEDLFLYGTAAINGTGNALDNRITGNAANNVLNGTTGSDTLIGGAGNDIYVIDGGDVIREAANGGHDTVRSVASYTLAANLEDLILTGGRAINGTGNALDNRITGNAANNMLNGGSGSDTLAGGAGNDIYVTDGGDLIIEAANAGIDQVNSSVTHRLGANLENLVLTGGAAINGYGNGLNNRITGNAADNILNGGTGADTFAGGAGNDIYVTDGNDVIIEAANAGIDQVNSSVSYTLGAHLETLVLTGTAAINGNGNGLNNRIVGNSAANSLNGGAGNDTINGAAGDDTILGGAGADTLIGGMGTDQIYGGADAVRDVFVFNSAAEAGLGATRDTVFNFRSGIDDFNLRNIDADTAVAGNQTLKFSGTSVAANAVWYQKSGADLILCGDVNGDRIADFEIRVALASRLDADDFLL